MIPNDPVSTVRWVNADWVQANDYNPNSVARNELHLLYISILHDGYTQPIVTVIDHACEIILPCKHVVKVTDSAHPVWKLFPPLTEAVNRTCGVPLAMGCPKCKKKATRANVKDASRAVIVDGFHRHLVCKTHKDISERTGGRVPIVVIDKKINDRAITALGDGTRLPEWQAWSSRYLMAAGMTPLFAITWAWNPRSCCD